MGLLCGNLWTSDLTEVNYFQPKLLLIQKSAKRLLTTSLTISY